SCWREAWLREGLLRQKVVVEPEAAVTLDHQPRAGPAPALDRLMLTQRVQGLRRTVGVAGGEEFGLVFGVFAHDEVAHLAGGIARMLQVDDHVRARPVFRQALRHAAGDLGDRLELGGVRLLGEAGVKPQQRDDRRREYEASHDAIILGRKRRRSWYALRRTGTRSCSRAFPSSPSSTPWRRS